MEQVLIRLLPAIGIVSVSHEQHTPLVLRFGLILEYGHLPPQTNPPRAQVPINFVMSPSNSSPFGEFS